MKRFLFLLAALLLSAAPVTAATIEGRVVRGEAAQAGMIVTAHKAVDPAAPVLAQAISDSDGLYRLVLPEGRYALFARHPEAGLFAFSGRNPVEVHGEQPLWAGLQTVPVVAAALAPYDDPYAAALSGTVLLDGQPLAGAIVTLYLDTADDLKGQGYRMSLPTGGDGSFFFDGLPAADYHLVARRHADGSRVGPMRDNDEHALYPGNPLLLAAGKTTQVTMTAVRKIRETETAVPFSRNPGLQLQGIIVDPAGQPQAGLHLFAYRDKVIGHKRPEAISAPTGADGAFRIAFPTAGIYYIGAREKYGDSPAPGELFGMYEASADHGLQINGTTPNTPVRIVVEPVDLQ
ncbi:MAG: carboxypeptidase regulatory-like domain-containing protein [Desulfuromonadales bacterium]|nr:carboxypeptidase regulatory-like domain-containing protein [Desulfuromonadales bacterium]